MDKYRGRVALVTGASAGIGAAIVQALLRHGMTVVGLARRAEKIKELELKDASGKLHAVSADLTDEGSLLAAFRWIDDTLGGVDVLVNNAGIYEMQDLTSGRADVWKRIMDINVLGLSICTREAVQGMLKRGVDDGFVIHISSGAAHFPPPYSAYAMGSASKQMVRVLLAELRKDLVSRGSNIRVGEICPGTVKTEHFMEVLQRLPEHIRNTPCMESDDIAEAVVFMLSQHPRVQVHDIIVNTTGSSICT